MEGKEMDKVVPIKKRIEETDYCAGCGQEFDYNETYKEIKIL